MNEYNSKEALKKKTLPKSSLVVFPRRQTPRQRFALDWAVEDDEL